MRAIDVFISMFLSVGVTKLLCQNKTWARLPVSKNTTETVCSSLYKRYIFGCVCVKRCFWRSIFSIPQ